MRSERIIGVQACTLALQLFNGRGESIESVLNIGRVVSERDVELGVAFQNAAREQEFIESPKHLLVREQSGSVVSNFPVP